MNVNTPVTITSAILVAQVSQYQTIRIVIYTRTYSIAQVPVAHNSNQCAGAIELAEQLHLYAFIDPR